MALATSNRDGGRTSESGHLRAIYKAFGSGVLLGLATTQRGAGANMSVDIAIGDAIIGRSDGTYGHPAWNDAVYNQVVSAADVSNPRRDIIVMYIDYANAVTTTVSNNTNGVVKIKVVNGTPAGSPVDPTDAAIQSSVGSGNPYIKLGRVRLPAGAISVTTSVIDDIRTFATPSLGIGAPLQMVSTTSSALITGTTAIPIDDTIPQITEGFQVMTQIITPKSATNILTIEIVAHGAVSAIDFYTLALFQDATVNALAATNTSVDVANGSCSVPLSHSMVAGTTSATTFRVRVGPINPANTLSFNGRAGNRHYGAITKSFIKITEYKA